MAYVGLDVGFPTFSTSFVVLVTGAPLVGISLDCRLLQIVYLAVSVFFVSSPMAYVRLDLGFLAFSNSLVMLVAGVAVVRIF